MSKRNAEYSAEHYLAAMKLIEQLYKDGLISAQILRSILNDYADVVDSETQTNNASPPSNRWGFFL